MGLRGAAWGPMMFINGSLVSSGPAWQNSVLEGHFHALVASLQCWVRPRAQKVYPSEPSLQAEGLPSPAVCGTLFSLCTACPAEAMRLLWLLPQTLSSSPRSMQHVPPRFLCPWKHYMQLFIHSMSTKPHYKAAGIQLGSKQKRPCSQGAYTLTGKCIHERQCSAMVYSQLRCPGACARGVQTVLSGPQGSLVKVKSELQPEDKMLM